MARDIHSRLKFFLGLFKYLSLECSYHRWIERVETWFAFMFIPIFEGEIRYISTLQHNKTYQVQFSSLWVRGSNIKATNNSIEVHMIDLSWRITVAKWLSFWVMLVIFDKANINVVSRKYLGNVINRLWPSPTFYDPFIC